MLPLFAAAAAVSTWEGFAAGVSLGVAVYKKCNKVVKTHCCVQYEKGW